MMQTCFRFMILGGLSLPITGCLVDPRVLYLQQLHLHQKLLKPMSPASMMTEIPGRTDFTNSLGMKFVFIPAATFTMGSPELEVDRTKTEMQHSVTLTKGFYLQTTEVTQGQWITIMPNNPSKYTGDKFLPVEQVSWLGVQLFIQKLNDKKEGSYRLPTEAQWEYAARAGTTTAYSCGDNENCLDNTDWYLKYDRSGGDLAWYNAVQQSHPNFVAQKLPNAWGLYDMHGNVSEWVQDWYGNYPHEPVTDPVGPSTGTRRVIRGGSWYVGSQYARSAMRFEDVPDAYIKDTGFRLVYKP